MIKVLNVLDFLRGSNTANNAIDSCDLGNAQATSSLVSILYYVRIVLNIIQIAVPIALILFGTIDMAKAVMAGDEKKMKEAQKPFVKRIISAVIVFLIPYIVTVVIGIVTSNTQYKGCWDAAKSKEVNTSVFDNALDTTN